MAERLRRLVSLRRRTLVVALPAECDDGMRRDGVNPVPPKGVGERAWWLGQLVSAAPLSMWTDLARPSDLLRMPVEGCDPRLLTLGWAAPAVRERNADWVQALLDGDITIGAEQVAGLVAVLPPEHWAPVMKRLTYQRPQPELLLALPAPWPPALGNLVLDGIAGHPDRRTAARLADVAAHAVPPECLDHPLTGRQLTHETPPWLRRLIDTLTFRRAMYEELP